MRRPRRHSKRLLALRHLPPDGDVDRALVDLTARVADLERAIERQAALATRLATLETEVARHAIDDLRPMPSVDDDPRARIATYVRAHPTAKTGEIARACGVTTRMVGRCRRLAEEDGKTLAGDDIDRASVDARFLSALHTAHPNGAPRDVIPHGTDGMKMIFVPQETRSSTGSPSQAVMG